MSSSSSCFTLCVSALGRRALLQHDCRDDTTLAYSSFFLRLLPLYRRGDDTTGATCLLWAVGQTCSTGVSSSPSNTWTATGATLNSDLIFITPTLHDQYVANLRLCRRIVIRLRGAALRELSPHLPCSIIVQYVADLLQLLRLPHSSNCRGSRSRYCME